MQLFTCLLLQVFLQQYKRLGIVMDVLAARAQQQAAGAVPMSRSVSVQIRDALANHHILQPSCQCTDNGMSQRTRVPSPGEHVDHQLYQHSQLPRQYLTSGTSQNAGVQTPGAPFAEDMHRVSQHAWQQPEDVSGDLLGLNASQAVTSAEGRFSDHPEAPPSIEMGSPALTATASPGKSVVGHLAELGGPQWGSQALFDSPQMGPHAMLGRPQMSPQALLGSPQMSPHAMLGSPQTDSHTMFGTQTVVTPQRGDSLIHRGNPPVTPWGIRSPPKADNPLRDPFSIGAPPDRGLLVGDQFGSPPRVLCNIGTLPGDHAQTSDHLRPPVRGQLVPTQRSPTPLQTRHQTRGVAYSGSNPFNQSYLLQPPQSHTQHLLPHLLTFQQQQQQQQQHDAVLPAAVNQFDAEMTLAQAVSEATDNDLLSIMPSPVANYLLDDDNTVEMAAALLDLNTDPNQADLSHNDFGHTDPSQFYFS